MVSLTGRKTIKAYLDAEKYSALEKTLEKLESSKDEFQLFKYYRLVEKEKLLETMIHASMEHRIPQMDFSHITELPKHNLSWNSKFPRETLILVQNSRDPNQALSLCLWQTSLGCMTVKE